jgi:hypothetical protein
VALAIKEIDLFGDSFFIALIASAARPNAITIAVVTFPPTKPIAKKNKTGAPRLIGISDFNIAIKRRENARPHPSVRADAGDCNNTLEPIDVPGPRTIIKVAMQGIHQDFESLLPQAKVIRIAQA